MKKKKKKNNYIKTSAVIAIINTVLLIFLAFVLPTEILFLAIVNVIPLILYFAKIKNYTWVTILFIIINDLVFLICFGYLVYWFIFSLGHSNCNELICFNTTGIVILGLFINFIVFLPYIILSIDMIKNRKKKKKKTKTRKRNNMI
ncbi:MAG: hypothetical protein IJH13_02355 [Bacilli bacterium]|nr:hypothetical protein [Bacilli bacterium]